MDFFIDAEFVESEREIDLISLAVVDANGSELYAISTEFDPSRANEFVREAVLPNLEPPDHRAWKSRQQIKDDLLRFVGDRLPRFWSWGGTPYDWLAMAQLFPLAERVPDGWRYSAYDVSLLVEMAGLRLDPVDDSLPPPPTSHHALDDARWARDVFLALNPWRNQLDPARAR